MGNKKLLDDLLDQILLKFKTSETINDMAKVSIKFEKSTLYGRIIHEGEQFSRHVGPIIDKVLRGRCKRPLSA